MAPIWSWLVLALLAASPAMARPSLVCRVTARVPFRAAVAAGSDSSRVFVQTADVLEERRSGSSLVQRWLVVMDTPEQLVAADLDRSLTLLIDRHGGGFSESGVEVQRRGYCRVNDLP